MEYKYDSPVNAIISLEKAYTEKDLKGIINSKDFKTEAKIILIQADYNYNINDSLLIDETATLLETSLIKTLNDNGFPSFNNVKREFSELELSDFDDNIYLIQEKLIFPDNVLYTNKIFLTNINSAWKIAMIEE